MTQQVKNWYSQDDNDIFLEERFSHDEVRKAVHRLNKGKAPGFDSITAEHLQHAGRNIIVLLTEIFNRAIELEYIPSNLKVGTQIPLYKGKNSCTLDQNNYRGITLLTSLNKVFEILIRERMKGWWEGETVISPLQGACRLGKSCIHSALTLQEAIAVGLDTKKIVFVTYLDVAKAFDCVWTDGLFYHLHNMGVVGRVGGCSIPLIRIFDVKCALQVYTQTGIQWSAVYIRGDFSPF